MAAPGGSSAVVVTGAASGMGRAAARRLHAEGNVVVACDLDEQGLAALGKEVASDGGAGELMQVVLDVSDRVQVGRAVERVVDAFGQIDALLHFAAILDRTPLEQVDEASWNRVLQVNLSGTFWITQAVAGVMVRQRSGSIVLVASDSARAGSLVSGPAYAASKGGTIALVKTLAKYLGPSNVRVNGISPGLTYTGMSDLFPRDVVERTISLTPLGRLGDPEDMADVAIFLISDRSRFMTGEIVEVNGGFYLD